MTTAHVDLVAWCCLIVNLGLLVYFLSGCRRVRRQSRELTKASADLEKQSAELVREAELVTESAKLTAAMARFAAILDNHPAHSERDQVGLWQCRACGLTGGYSSGPLPPGVAGVGFSCPHCGVIVELTPKST